jgi:ADP-L-glycero-D-manno-heptose 6-epimerase
MYLLTGAAGFIASYYLRWANAQGRSNFILVDDFTIPQKQANWQGLGYQALVPRTELWPWLEHHGQSLKGVIHLGARTDTTEQHWPIFEQLNLSYSQKLFAFCAQNQLPLVYASSAATYGAGEQGYSDHTPPSMLQPLNPYGRSKNDFDAWALEQAAQPPFWAGLKFFNVYGPGEGHKGRMASVVYHTYQQIKATGEMKLFRSHRPEVADGQQSRDFVYVQDLAQVIDFMLEKQPYSGLYNLGTGQARSFWDLAAATFHGLGLSPKISFIDIPQDIRESYQYFTQADMSKLRAAGYTADFKSLEQGVAAYVAWLSAQA